LTRSYAVDREYSCAIHRQISSLNCVSPIDVIYFVQALDGQPKIFAFIAGDEQKVYEEKGIVPYSLCAISERYG
jgi:uncharacterized ParB-like nuclease family protein